MSVCDGRCPNCGEDELDGARCYYCGWHDYSCDMPDCEWCNDTPPNPTKGAAMSMEQDVKALAWERRTVAVWDEWRHGPWRVFKDNFYGDWKLSDNGSVVFSAPTLQEVMQCAEARIARAAIAKATGEQA